MFELNLKRTEKKIENFIQSVCKKEGFKNVLIGVSGGVDSATSLTLAVNALGRSHVWPVLLPYGEFDDEHAKDAFTVVKANKILLSQVVSVDIKPIVDSFKLHDKRIDQIRLGNVMARARMMVLFDLARKNSRLVLGTENKSEHLLGYFTRFGDEASDIEPLRGLYKTQIFMLAKYLGVPEKILTKSPSAGLWQNQTDEKEFGFSYKTADEILFLHFEKRFTRKKLPDRFGKKLVDKVWFWIEKGEFKKRVPYILEP